VHQLLLAIREDMVGCKVLVITFWEEWGLASRLRALPCQWFLAG